MNNFKPRFLNPEGYSIVKDIERSTRWNTIYEYTTGNPSLTYRDKHGNIWRPDNHYFTNQGTTPLGIGKDRFLGYYLHDSACIFGGLWQWQGDKWVFVKLTRRQADDMLYDMVLADPQPGWKSTACTIWLGVRIGAMFQKHGAGDSEYRFSGKGD